MADVVRWVDTQETGQVAAILERAASPEPLQAAQATWYRDERTRSSVYTTAETVLAPFAHEAATPAPGPPFEPEDLLGDANTLFLCAPAHDQRRLRGYFTARHPAGPVPRLRHRHTSRPAARPAAAGRARRGGAHRAVARARRLGRDVCVARDPVGHGLAGPGPGAGPLRRPRPDRLEQPPGQAVPPRHRRPRHARLRQPAHRRRGSDQPSVTRDPTGRRSTTSTTGPRRLLPPEELRCLPRGQAVLVYGTLPPARLQLRPWPWCRATGAGVVQARRRERPSAPCAPSLRSQRPGWSGHGQTEARALRRWSPAAAARSNSSAASSCRPTPVEQVPADAGQEVIALQRPGGNQHVHERERVGGPGGHGDRDRRG